MSLARIIAAAAVLTTVACRPAPPLPKPEKLAAYQAAVEQCLTAFPIYGGRLRTEREPGKTNVVRIEAEANQPVRALREGIVTAAPINFNIYGTNHLFIWHLENGVSTIDEYAGIGQPNVRKDQSVRAGDVIANVFPGGDASNHGSHVRIYMKDAATDENFDPMPILMAAKECEDEAMNAHYPIPVFNNAQ